MLRVQGRRVAEVNATGADGSGTAIENLGGSAHHICKILGVGLPFPCALMDIRDIHGWRPRVP